MELGQTGKNKTFSGRRFLEVHKCSHQEALKQCQLQGHPQVSSHFQKFPKPGCCDDTNKSQPSKAAFREECRGKKRKENRSNCFQASLGKAPQNRQRCHFTKSDQMDENPKFQVFCCCFVLTENPSLSLYLQHNF